MLIPLDFCSATTQLLFYYHIKIGCFQAMSIASVQKFRYQGVSRCIDRAWDKASLSL